MNKLVFPHVILPSEFVQLLKANITASTPVIEILDVLRKNRALFRVLEQAFKNLDDGRGFEKTCTALGWANFRDRLASVYIFRSLHGQFPISTSMELVEEIKQLEGRFFGHGVQGPSRAFLLGFYLRLATIHIQKRENNKFLEITIPEDLLPLLRLSQGRSEKIDWLILILLHLYNSLGAEMTTMALKAGRTFDEMYPLMTPQARKSMMDNFLVYAASTRESDIFIYDKV
jgi:hypothetical protein